MNRVSFKPAKRAAKPCTWTPILDGRGNRVSASLICPKGHYATLQDHTILVDGAVMPSVECPEPGCGFHELVFLEDWHGN